MARQQEAPVCVLDIRSFLLRRQAADNSIHTRNYERLRERGRGLYMYIYTYTCIHPHTLLCDPCYGLRRFRNSTQNCFVCHLQDLEDTRVKVRTGASTNTIPNSRGVNIFGERTPFLRHSLGEFHHLCLHLRALALLTTVQAF